MKKALSYKDAGVNIKKADLLVDRIKSMARTTFRPEVVSSIGGFVELIRRLADAVGFAELHRQEYDLEGGDRDRPRDAALVVMLLDRGGNHARHPDAVASHG